MKPNELETQLAAFPGDQIGSPAHIDLLLALAWEIRYMETPRALALSIQAEENARCQGDARGLVNGLLD